jgi:SagB-type dehydrogenase family enzyme
MSKLSVEDYRSFLKDNVRQLIDFSETDQNRGVEAPPLQKPYSAESQLYELPAPKDFEGVAGIDLSTAIASRQSVRKYRDEALTLKELSFLLWATQGVRKVIHNICTLRTVPSAGARHALETYLYVHHVEGLPEGIYRYLPLEHDLLFEFSDENLSKKIAEAALDQSFVGAAAATFIWTTIPYRMEWRYERASCKVIALDAGHVCQNLYLACEAIGAGTCAVAAYDQELMDQLIRVNGEDEFVIYLAAVGKK